MWFPIPICHYTLPIISHSAWYIRKSITQFWSWPFSFSICFFFFCPHHTTLPKGNGFLQWIVSCIHTVSGLWSLDWDWTTHNFRDKIGFITEIVNCLITIQQLQSTGYVNPWNSLLQRIRVPPKAHKHSLSNSL